MGAYEEAPQRGADTGKGHAMSFSLHLRASTSKQRLIKKKGRAYMFVGRPLLSWTACSLSD